MEPEPAEEEVDTVGVVEEVSDVMKRFFQKRKTQKERRNFRDYEERAYVPIFARMEPVANEPVATEDHSYSGGRMHQVPAISRNQLVPFREVPNISNIPISQQIKDIVLAAIEAERRLPFLSPHHPHWQRIFGQLDRNALRNRGATYWWRWISKWRSTAAVAARSGQPGSSVDARILQYWQGPDEPERTQGSVPQSCTGTANCGCPKHQ